MSQRSLGSSAEVASVFGHPLRLGIMTMLAQEPRNVSELVSRTGVDQAQVSKHLSILRGAGLLQCSPEGRCRVYSLADAPEVRSVLEALAVLGERAAANRLRCEARTTSARAES